MAPEADPPRGASRAMVGALAIATVLGLAELPFASFMADDLIQLGALEGVTPDTWTGPLQLYTISDGRPEHVRAMKDVGAFPWFFDPKFEMAFARPLSSALLALDHALFGLTPVGYRAHGVVWFLLLVAGLGTVLRRVLPGPLGALALIVFTISGIHGILCWTATRHIVIAGALGVWALSGHLRWREDGWRPGLPLSLAGFALALAASEAAVGALAYLLAYEMLGLARGARRGWAALPAAALVAIYLATYRLLDLGASGGSGYLDPLREPLVFAMALPARLAFLLGAMVLGGNADLWVLRPDLRPGLVAVGVAALFLLAVLVRAVWSTLAGDERRHARWLLAGSVLAAVPFSGTPIGSRCLVIPLLGGCVAIALVLHRGWTDLRRRPGIVPRLRAAACALLALLHLALAPLQRLAAPVLLRELMSTRLATAMAEAELDHARIADQTVVVLAAPDIAVGLHAYFHRALFRMPMPAAWRSLSWAPHEHRFTRTADDTLVMDVVDGSMEGPHLAAGDVVAVDGLTATVLDTGRIGPSRVEFRFDRPLDDPSLWLLSWQDGQLRHIAPPAQGDELRIAR